MSSPGDGSEPPRHPKDFQSLLKICMENMEYEGASGSSAGVGNVREHDLTGPERTQWLSHALEEFSGNIVHDMMRLIADIKEKMKSFPTQSNESISHETISEITTSMDALIEHVESIDNASDFYKIGGFEIFAPLLACSSGQLRAKAGELIGEMCQNHDECQGYVLQTGLLETLLKILDEDADVTVRVKALYAISSVIRDNEAAQHVFGTQLNGFQVLLHVIEGQLQVDSDLHREHHRLGIKACFLITSLCRHNQQFRETVFQLGYIDVIVSLLHHKSNQDIHDASHEHLLSALLSLVSNHEPSKLECQRNDLQLESLLKHRIKVVTGKEEFLEEDEYCKQLLKLCFNYSELPESER